MYVSAGLKAITNSPAQTHFEVAMDYHKGPAAMCDLVDCAFHPLSLHCMAKTSSSTI